VRSHRRNPAITRFGRSEGLESGAAAAHGRCHWPAHLETVGRNPNVALPAPGPLCLPALQPAAPGPGASRGKGGELGGDRARSTFQLQAEQGACVGIQPGPCGRCHRAGGVGIAVASEAALRAVHGPPTLAGFEGRGCEGPRQRRHFRCAVNTSPRVWRHRRGCPSASPCSPARDRAMARSEQGLSSLLEQRYGPIIRSRPPRQSALMGSRVAKFKQCSASRQTVFPAAVLAAFKAAQASSKARAPVGSRSPTPRCRDRPSRDFEITESVNPR